MKSIIISFIIVLKITSINFHLIGNKVNLITIKNCISIPSDTIKNKTKTEYNYYDNLQRQIDSIRKDLKDLIICNISSPVEQTFLIKHLKLAFNKNLLLKCNSKNYILDTEKALALGAYGVDLAYLNIYEINSLQFNYLDVIYRLSLDLGISNLLNYNQIKFLIENSNNSKSKDELLLTCTQNINNIEETMMKSNTSHIGALIIIGAWIEGTYMLTQTVKKWPRTKMLRERVAEQKLYMHELMKLLNIYKNQPGFDKIYHSIFDIYQDFQSVEYKVEILDKAQKMDAILQSDVNVNKGTEVSYSNISDKTLIEITKKIKKLRESLFKT